MQITNLADGTSQELQRLCSTFSKNNPGYDMWFESGSVEVSISNRPQIVFVQAGQSIATVSSLSTSLPVGVGDIILLRANTSATFSNELDVLAFELPNSTNVPSTLPMVIRPDHDPKIADERGGCATELDTYRRVLLTWLKSNGPYQFEALNAHRVLIRDSFTHYHPIVNGFDEFYLVQDATDDARLLISHQVEEITQPASISAETVDGLFQSHQLRTHDLVYIPKGTVHRGLGGVLAQVITVPGFIPGSEIGVDHHLLEINRNLRLDGANSLPYNVEASTSVVIK